MSGPTMCGAGQSIAVITSLKRPLRRPTWSCVPFSHPDLREGATVTIDPVYVALVMVAKDLPTTVVVGALRPERAGVTCARLGFVDDLVSSGVGGLRPQDLSRRAPV